MITKYGDDIVNATKDLAKSDAKEAIELINTYGDDAFKMVKSKQTGDLVKKVCEGLKENNISFDEFQRVKTLKDVDLIELEKTNRAEYDRISNLMRKIREKITINKGTRMKKVLTDDKARRFYIDKITSNNEVSGFVSRVEDSKYLSHNYEDVVETNRLDYLINGTREFPDGGSVHWEMEFNIANEGDMSGIKVPYGTHFKGTETSPEPFKGNGFTGGENGTTIPEWKIGERIQIDDGAILTKFENGKVVERYKYDKDAGRWLKFEN